VTLIMASPDKSIQDQLNLVISMLTEQAKTLNETRNMLAESQAKVTVLENKVSALESKVSVLESDLLTIKEVTNNREQASKLCSIRVHGLPVTDDELAATDGGKTLSNKVYDRVLKPILVAAKAKGDISSVPHCPNVVEECYRAGRPTKSGKPAPVVVKISNKNLRLAILRNKRSNIPLPLETERTEFVKRFTVVEDLTGPTFRLLKQLQDQDSVARAWTVEGRIRFVTNENPNTVKSVKSVFMPIEAILSSK
jgi:uncharacterized coiled-coil protein SlyX